MCRNGHSSERTGAVCAEAFCLVDAEGTERGRFALDHQDNPALSLCDRQGQVRARIRLDEDGNPSLDLNVPHGEGRVLLTLGTPDSPRLWLYGAGSEDARLGLLVDENGTAAVDLWSLENENSITLFANADGELSFAFWHENEATPRLGFCMEATGALHGEAFDAGGKPVWRLPAAGPADDPE